MLDLAARGSLADLGCGSGVLAIAAAKLGFGPVTALDSDRDAVEATRQNAAANAVELDRVERFDLRAQAPPRAGVITANLMRPLLLRVAELMEEPPAPWWPRACWITRPTRWRPRSTASARRAA